jgi:hypothetical protein
MDSVFEITDKTGRKIILTENRWEHIIQHKGMEQYLGEIKDVLINPDFTVPHFYDKTKRNYYKYYKNKKRYLLISVKYINGEGEVKTAFMTRKIRRR